MVLYLIISACLAIFASILAIQNAAPVQVTFLFWRFNQSLAVIIILATIIGAVLASAIFIPVLIKNKWTLSRLRHQSGESERKQ